MADKYDTFTLLLLAITAIFVIRAIYHIIGLYIILRKSSKKPSYFDKYHNVIEYYGDFKEAPQYGWDGIKCFRETVKYKTENGQVALTYRYVSEGVKNRIENGFE